MKDNKSRPENNANNPAPKYEEPLREDTTQKGYEKDKDAVKSDNSRNPMDVNDLKEKVPERT